MSANDPNHVAYVRGHKLFKRGRFAPAAKWFSVAIEEWPEDWQALWALGNCHSEFEETQKAERCFRAALELASPKDRPKLIFNLGNALFDQQRFREAITVYQELPAGHDLICQAKNNIARAQAKLTNET